MAVPGALIGIIWMLAMARPSMSIADGHDRDGRHIRLELHPGGQFLPTICARARATTPFEAVIATGAPRLRPSDPFAMILGMIPMALGAGEAGEQNAPLGRR
jgi:hypothetical protein